MYGVHDVLKAFERTVGHQMDVLIPVGTAHQHDVIRIVTADFADDLRGILLQAGPRVLDGLVVYLIDNVRIVTIFLSHLAKKLTGLAGVHVMRVPVDDDIDILLDGSLDDGCQTRHGQLRILQIAALRVFRWLNANGSTHHRTMPVALQRLHHLLVIEARPPIMPAETDATQCDRIALLVAQLRTPHLQLTVLFDRIYSH